MPCYRHSLYPSSPLGVQIAALSPTSRPVPSPPPALSCLHALVLARTRGLCRQTLLILALVPRVIPTDHVSLSRWSEQLGHGDLCREHYSHGYGVCHTHLR